MSSALKIVLLILAVHINIIFIYRMFLSEERKDYFRELIQAHPLVIGTSDACIIALLVYLFAFSI